MRLILKKTTTKESNRMTESIERDPKALRAPTNTCAQPTTLFAFLLFGCFFVCLTIQSPGCLPYDRSGSGSDNFKIPTTVLAASLEHFDKLLTFHKPQSIESDHDPIETRPGAGSILAPEARPRRVGIVAFPPAIESKSRPVRSRWHASYLFLASNQSPPPTHHHTPPPHHHHTHTPPHTHTHGNQSRRGYYNYTALVSLDQSIDRTQPAD